MPTNFPSFYPDNLVKDFSSHAQIFPKQVALSLSLAVLVGMTSHSASAMLLYQAITPDGRTVTVNNPTKAYQLNPDTSKITVIDTDKLADYGIPSNTEAPSIPAPAPAPTYTPPTYSTTTTTNSDTTTKTLSISQPLIIQPTAPPADTDFDELNISSTQASKQGDYQLSLITPIAESLYRKPAQNIDVTVALKPALKKGDTLNLAIDGHVIKNGKDLTYQIPTTDIDPDKHTLTISVINVLNKPIASAETTFYLVQNNPLIQKKRQLAKQMAAYEALPWYEKLKLKLGFEDKKPDTSDSLNPTAKKNK